MKSPFLIGKSTINGNFQIAVLVYQRVSGFQGSRNLFLTILYFSVEMEKDKDWNIAEENKIIHSIS